MMKHLATISIDPEHVEDIDRLLMTKKSNRVLGLIGLVMLSIVMVCLLATVLAFGGPTR